MGLANIIATLVLINLALGMAAEYSTNTSWYSLETFDEYITEHEQQQQDINEMDLYDKLVNTVLTAEPVGDLLYWGIRLFKMLLWATTNTLTLPFTQNGVFFVIAVMFSLFRMILWAYTAFYVYAFFKNKQGAD